MTEPENYYSLLLAAQIPLALVVLVAGLGCYAGQAPNPVPASAAPELFSAERALRHSPNFAREPHPAGTEALEHVRDYLLAQLNNCGVEAQMQRATVIEDHSISYVENVLGRIPRTNNNGAFVATAHYDSVYSGPGAADDGAGVITMLEAARAGLGRGCRTTSSWHSPATKSAVERALEPSRDIPGGKTSGWPLGWKREELMGRATCLRPAPGIIG
jgi:hypothetical protein